MFRRYMPLMFVVLVVIATALVFLLLRDAGEPAAPVRSTSEAAQENTGPDGVRVFRVESEAEYLLALEALNTSTDEIEAWARSRGFPPATYTNSPGQPLQHNYRRVRDDRLRALAEGGDQWAMQFLAARIAPVAPLEAIDWYRKAIVSGSAYSALKLGTLYQDIARWMAINQDDREELIQIAQLEEPLAYTSLGWLLLAEYDAGLPPGSISASLTSFHAADEGIMRACERAATFLAEIRKERQALGTQIAVHRPPLAVELPPEETTGYCPPDVFPHADFSGCEKIHLAGDAGAVFGHRCRD
jgi:hypothetical protein